MNLQLAILIVFVILLVLSFAGTIAIAWMPLCIAYLATCQAANVLISVRG